MRATSVSIIGLIAVVLTMSIIGGLLVAGCRNSPYAAAPANQASPSHEAPAEIAEDKPDSDKQQSEEHGSEVFGPLTADTFEELVENADRPVVVMFVSSKCGYCEELKQRIAELADEYGDAINFLTVNTDTGKQLIMEFKVHKFPTVYIFSRGREIDYWNGLKSKETLKRHFDHLVRERR